ncbi:MAG: tetratricopeptide repeat protein [Candidatus Thermoplasmatota archaeon]|nr:tetratricopeptide repeat protein [Candidatus Thermoplasmatota archaeon]
MTEEQFLRAMERGDVQEARRILATIKDSIPRTRVLYFEGMVHDCLGEPEEALKKFNMALVLHLSDPPIWLAKARVLLDLGKLEMARRSVDRACRLAPGNPYAHLLHAEILYKMKEYRGATEQIDDAMDLAPDDPEVLTLKGILVSIKDEDYLKALSFFDRALTSDENHSPAWTNRGVVLRRIGDRDGAIYSFHKALTLDAGDHNAREMLKNIGADEYIVPARVERSDNRLSKRTRHMIDEAPRGHERKKTGDGPDEPEPGDEQTVKEEDRPGSREYSEEEPPGEEEAEGRGADQDIMRPEDELDGESTGGEDAYDDLDEMEEEVDEFEEDEGQAPAAEAPPEGVAVTPEKKRKLHKLDLDCPRCGASFKVTVSGATKFSCPSCGLSGQIE